MLKPMPSAFAQKGLLHAPPPSFNTLVQYIYSTLMANFLFMLPIIGTIGRIYLSTLLCVA